ncbi:MAG: hypothetical protein JXR37_10385 [Kiritimatiellae bacterium]|nr:hypothetical protein [Kiritimatiellia bacterium]
MPDISFNCPKCDGNLVVDAKGAGMELECPHCKDTIIVPQHVGTDIYFRCGACGASLVIDEQAAGMDLECPTCQKTIPVPNLIPCPFCGETIVSDAIKCEHCYKALIEGPSG